MQFVPLGTPDELFQFIKSHRKRTRERSFNNIEIQPRSQKVVKSSTRNASKIEEEWRWFKKVNELGGYLSRHIPIVGDLHSDSKNINKSYDMEYLPYQSLSELFLYENLQQKEIKQILSKLVNIVAVNQANTNITFRDSISEDEFKKHRQEIYSTKTLSRIVGVLKQESILDLINSYSSIVLNDVRTETKKVEIFQIIEDILNYRGINSICHGDYCFPNIMYDRNSGIVKLLDPRGLKKNESIFNKDSYYELAKVRHSLSGYDLIVNGFYNIQKDGDRIDFEIYWNNNFNKNTTNLFDSMLANFGYNVKIVKRIEALLFLTMIPLHDEDSDRQLAFYLLFLLKMNEL